METLEVRCSSVDDSMGKAVAYFKTHIRRFTALAPRLL